jgi:hypothetical protein
MAKNHTGRQPHKKKKINQMGRQPLQQTKRGDNPYKKNHTRRNFAPKINQAIHEEVEKLLQAGFI